ncbi:NAD(P)H-dependent oxidoreductase [Rhodopseudomonas palustris]|uniref:NAD(P)H-dependent oxidoreductase n=1 Tax=Rhodopseudomonas palustris TaxID=1076 RepID=UPI00115DBBE3|nr:NAD(P)H-dependent oxidoreductase [Rhodopseudomonas palustris]QDL97488.1 NAD(P)H-dependent oxidoreductase [Rhodopseudomonas palustris]
MTPTRCLVVVAHPLSDSLCGQLGRDAQAVLKRAGHEVRLLDLHAAGFAPALTAAERSSYYAAFDQSELAAEIDDLSWAETLVLVFPTWWFGMPALMKGWFDRVWAPGVAYDHASDLGRIRPRLRSLRRVVAITTLGSPWWIDRLVLRQPVKRILKTAILGTCAPQAKLTFLSFYGCEQLDAAAVTRIQTRVASALAAI